MKGKFIQKTINLFLVAILLIAIIPVIGEAESEKFSADSIADMRISGADRYETAVNISKKGWSTGTETVVLSRGDLFADALSGVPLASKLNAPILLTRSTELTEVTKQEILRLQASKVVLLGSKGAVSEKVENTLKQMGLQVDRISGIDRYETSVNIAEKLGAAKTKAVLATGLNFPDALSIAPVAAEKGYPILLTRKDALSEKVKTFLNGYESTMIVGGASAVSTEIENTLPNPERISGATRYETATAIIEKEYKSNDHIYVSTGDNFSDALTGAALAAKNHTAVLIVGKQDPPVETERLIAGNQIKNFEVFGGKSAVSDNIISKLIGLINQFKDTTGVGVVDEHAKLVESSQRDQFEAAISTAAFDENTEKATLKLSQTEAQKYQVDDLIFLPPDENYPTGFMAKVESADANGNVIISQPTVDQLLPYFKIDPESTVLDPSKLIDFQLQEGVTIEEDGQQISSFTEWQSINSNQLGYEATTPSTIKPLKFTVNKKLYENEDKTTKLALKGNLTIKEITADPDLEKNWIGLPTAFDFKFNSKQDMALNVEVEAKDGFETKDQSKNITKGWFKASGVDRKGRTSLATLTYQIGTVPVYGLGNSGYEEIPVGVTLFVTANAKGTAKVTAKAGITWSSELDADAAYRDGNFDANADLTTSNLKVTADATGELGASIGIGLEPAINIMGVLPLTVQNDLTRSEEIKGSLNAIWNLYPESKWDWNGCFDYSNKLNFSSTLKARLLATADLGVIGEGEVEIAPYQKVLYTHDFFNTTKKYCARSGKITGTVKNAVSKEPLSGVTVNVYKGGDYLTSTKSKEDGSYEVELSDGTYTFTFDKFLYKSLTYNNVTINENVVNYSPELNMIGTEFLGDGIAKGTVINALNGQPIPDAVINVREALNTLDGAIVRSVESDALGKYTIEDLPAGVYTGEVQKSGFIKNTFMILSIGGRTTENQNVNITPILNDLETRIVLKWNNSPRDLDSHLTGPTLTDERFHVYFSNRDYSENNLVLAELDRDDTDYYGPETITIKNQKDGVYRYSIHDYSNKSYDNSYALSNSGATVEVYRGSYLIKTFNVPPNRPGTLWTVFEMNGDTIIPINTMTNQSSSNSVNSTGSQQSLYDLNVIYNSLQEKNTNNAPE